MGDGEEDHVVIVGVLALGLLFFEGTVFEQLDVFYLQPFYLHPVL